MDEALQDAPALEPRDRALAFHILAVSLRRLGTLRTLLAGMLERGLPRSAPRLEAILLTGAAQI
ncbi:hypothetical protein NL425_26185, partial [Klebsiella pneumoniae]|nr:hypothetical protein [Klebsiella pneumoniae]